MTEGLYAIITSIISGLFALAVVWMTYRLNQIHTLVNSNMTAVLQAQRSLMQEVVDLKGQAGVAPTKQALDAIADLDVRIADRTNKG